jgi:hypothetical protein
MSPIPQLSSPTPRRNRTLALWVAIVAVAGLAGGAAFMALVPGRSQARDDQADLLVLGTWFVIAAAYAWMRWRPRKPYDAVAVRPKTEAFQAKRWRLMLLLAGYLGVVLTPLTAFEALEVTPAATWIDRVFKAVLFLAPCGLTLGVMTSGIYSRAWGALVDDELTATHRARAFSLGFGVAVAAGALALLAVMFRPDLGPAALPAVIGLSVAAAGARFALLERAAMADDG